MTTAPLSVLVVDRHWEWYRTALGEAFPELEVCAAPSFGEAASQLPITQVLLTMGVPLPGLHFTSDIAAAMPRLEWVQCLLSGPDHIRRALAGRHEVMITTVAGIHGPQVSEMALLHMLALGRGMRRTLRNQDASRWERTPQRILEGRVVGILGVGAVGTHLGRLAHALGMRVYGFSRRPRAVAGVERMFPRDALIQIAPQLDFLVSLLPLEADTHHLVGAQVLAAMKPTAYLLNLGRGGVVDEAALVAALRAGAIAGAGLDVFETEPLAPESPLWQMENVIVTAHLAGHHDLYAEQTMSVLKPNLRAFIDGRRDQMMNVVGGV